MKFKLTFFLLFFLGNLFAANPIWTNLDKVLIKKLVRIDKDSIHQLEAFFLEKNENQTFTNLGFGWKVWSPGRAGGYISITSEFYYYHDSLIALRINPDLPNKLILNKKYLKWYNGYFRNLDKNGLLAHTFNWHLLSEPLMDVKQELKVQVLKPTLRSLMYPSSHVSYYFSGGYSGGLACSRKFFRIYRIQ